MAEKKKRRKRRKNRKNVAAVRSVVISCTLILILVAAVFFFLNENVFHLSGVPTSADVIRWLDVGRESYVELDGGEAAVHYIDVGQGDCQLIVTEDCTVLIDAGEEKYVGTILGYLQRQGITRLDYVIGTHPHSDHIGGLSGVLQEMEVGELLMPELPQEMIPITSCYENLLDVIEEKQINARFAVQGDVITLGEGTYLQVLAPLHDDYEDLNNYSVVTRLIHGENTFLFTGDAERASENDILNNGCYIDSRVMKIAHHGSTSSSTLAFLATVSPEYAVISVGRDNAYGHPMPEVIQRLERIGAEIITTMEYGNIVFISDGKNLEIKTEFGKVQ